MKERRASQSKRALAAVEEPIETTLSEEFSQALNSDAPLPIDPAQEQDFATPAELDEVEGRAEGVKPEFEKPPFQRVELGEDDNPGYALRTAREQAGLSMEEIGALTKINERQLEAIESGDASRLPPETFAKAFIKSYCRVLNMDPRPIIHAYGFTETKALLRTGPAAVDQQVRLETLEAQVSAGAQILSNPRLDGKASGRRSLIYGLALAALGLMAAFYVPIFLANRNADSSAEQLASAPPVVQEPDPLPDGFDPNQMADAHGQPVDPAADAYPPASAADPAFSVPATQPEPQAPTLATSMPNPAPQAPVVQAPAPAPALVAAAPLAQPSATQAPAQPSLPPTATAPAPAAPSKPAASALGSGQAVLRFAFTGQSWLTVWDGNNQVLVSQDNPAGSAVVLKGNGPFKVIVGKPKAVTLNANGNAIAIAESTPGGVGRLVLR